MNDEERIEELQDEIRAMQNIPALREEYKQKVEELIKLRRKQIRKKKNAPDN